MERLTQRLQLARRALATLEEATRLIRYKINSY